MIQVVPDHSSVLIIHALAGIQLDLTLDGE